MSKKDCLIATAKTLLWKKGYESMSPALVLKESGAGQGSLYHHFSGKEALALTALEQTVDELCTEADAVFDAANSPINGIKDFLCIERPSLDGCQIGRLVSEQSVIESSLRIPIDHYFTHLSRRIESLLTEAKQKGEIHYDAPITSLASLIVSTIQGGYTLSRAKQDKAQLTQSCHGLIALLDGLE